MEKEMKEMKLKELQDIIESLSEMKLIAWSLYRVRQISIEEYGESWDSLIERIDELEKQKKKLLEKGVTHEVTPFISYMLF